MKLLVANWKSHKTVADGIEWLKIFTNFDLKTLNPELKIIICPPFTHLSSLTSFTSHKSLALGAQDISQFAQGSHTGDVSGENLSSLVQYVIIGHSERRDTYKETEEVISNKISQANNFALNPIVCVSKYADTNYDTTILVYEPVDAIGTGKRESIDEIIRFKKQVSHKPTNFLYGGSVDSENASELLSNDTVDGFLVGTHSLDPLSFFAIAQKF